jgi:hypothetical protein
MIINAIKLSLENMNRKFVDLSRLRFDDLSNALKKTLQKQKIQERPFAYEFYHQFRILWDSESIQGIVSEGLVIQAEVNKTYQYIPNLKKIPDFLLHKPNTNENFAVIEFKLASNTEGIRDDFEKLIAFKQRLQYNYLVEVVIGDENSLRNAMRQIKRLNNSDGEEIIIIALNTDLWKANDCRIRYRSSVA